MDSDDLPEVRINGEKVEPADASTKETINLSRTEMLRNAETHEDGTLIDTDDVRFVLKMDYEDFLEEYGE